MQIAFFSLIDPENQHAGQLDSLLQSGYRYAFALTHDSSEAEDLLQDACVALVRARAKWEKSYLFATIRNRFIDRYRRNKKILFVPLEGASDKNGGIDSRSEEQWELPDVIQAATLSRALGTLRVDEREVLFLALVEGYTAQQIAAMTKRPRGTVLSLLHRSKLKLRRLLLPDQQEQTHE